MRGRDENAHHIKEQFGLSVRAVLFSAVLCILSTAGLRADDIAYMGTVSGQFGTIDLDTGFFTSLGNTGITLAGMAVNNGILYGSSYHTGAGSLYTIDPANGAVTVVGTSGIDYDDFGSTTSGLFAIGLDADLYSINAGTGAATLIGPTGISFGTWRSLSNNSSTLYFAGRNLYAISTTTGASALVGSMGSEQEGAMLYEGGFLYGGDDHPGGTVDTLNVTTGAATIGPNVTGTSSAFFALAPDPLLSPASTPEPGTIALLLAGGAGIAALKRRQALG